MFNERIKKLRKEKGLKQKELGDLINVSKVSICKYEKGISKPTVDTLLDIAKVFDVSVDYLLGLSEKRKK